MPMPQKPPPMRVALASSNEPMTVFWILDKERVVGLTRLAMRQKQGRFDSTKDHGGQVEAPTAAAPLPCPTAAHLQVQWHAAARLQLQRLASPPCCCSPPTTAAHSSEKVEPSPRSSTDLTVARSTRRHTPTFSARFNFLLSRLVHASYP